MLLKELVANHNGLVIRCKAGDLMEELAKLQKAKDYPTFFFTFGVGQRLADHVQPIKAINMAEANKKMIEIHGREWAFPYTEKEFTSSSLINNYKRLALIIA